MKKKTLVSGALDQKRVTLSRAAKNYRWPLLLSLLSLFLTNLRFGGWEMFSKVYSLFSTLQYANWSNNNNKNNKNG